MRKTEDTEKSKREQKTAQGTKSPTTKNSKAEEKTKTHKTAQSKTNTQQKEKDQRNKKSTRGRDQEKQKKQPPRSTLKRRKTTRGQGGQQKNQEAHKKEDCRNNKQNSNGYMNIGLSLHECPYASTNQGRERKNSKNGRLTRKSFDLAEKV